MPGEFELRKGVHIKLLPSTASEFRILLFKRGLSMQEVFEEFCQRAIVGDRSTIELMDELVDRKRLKIVSQMTATDAESIFDAIEIDEMARKQRGKASQSSDPDEDDT